MYLSGHCDHVSMHWTDELQKYLNNTLQLYSMNNYQFMCYMHAKGLLYGKRRTLPVRTMRWLLVVICIVTPGTNWLLPVIWKLQGPIYW